MKHPTKKQFQKVIDLLYTVLPLTFDNKDHLNMGELRVSDGFHSCGTVHCFGGWFAVALLNEKILTGRVNYMDGGNAHHLRRSLRG